ncbi:TPA: protein jag [Streptococcus pyogenes]|nr:protein jag [Streptococcus pyogenes]
MVLFTGKTVEEAIETGLQELGLSRLKAHIKVISKEKKGFLGFGKKPAQVDIEATVETSNNRRQINLQIETPEAGRVIGYHGKVLKSLQLLAQNFLHDRYSKNFSVSLNVHDYVEHRTETLIDFTQKVAKRVLESGQDYTMDPMSNSERKIVHKTVSSIEGVDSYSEGNDPNRYVVVSLQR